MSTKTAANFIASVRFESLPQEVIEQGKRCIRDLIGVMIAAHDDEAVKAARKMASALGGKGEATLYGTGLKLPCNAAAFVNSVMASTLDMDDGSMGLPGHSRLHRGHPGCIIIPSALAVGERERVSGKSLIEAVVAGYEMSLATAWFIGETVLASRTGVYGAAASAAKLFGLTDDALLHTIHIAEAHSPAPTYAFIWNQTHMTKEAPAWAAMTGVSAALLAMAGFKGAPTIFDLPEGNTEAIASLGKEWEILGIYLKPHGACRCAHAAIDGTLKIIHEHDLHADHISRVIVGCSPQKSLNMSNPQPANIWQAQYSLPFVIGSAIVDREVGPQQLRPDRLTDEEILAQVDKIVLVEDSEVENALPDAFAGSIEIETHTGKTYRTFQHYPKGDPENPMTNEELQSKFYRLVSPVVGRQRTQDLALTIDRLEELDHIELLIEQMKIF